MPRFTSEQLGIAQLLSQQIYDSFEKQVAIFSKLFVQNSSKSIYQVWSKLDPAAHLVILFELGCFEEQKTPDMARCARNTITDITKRARKLRKFLDEQVEFERQLIRHARLLYPKLHFKPHSERVSLKTVVESEIAELNLLIDSVKRRRKPRDKWAARRIILAQEYVLRRVAYLGIQGRVSLNPAAIADIYEFTQQLSRNDDYANMPDNIRKGIDNFRKNPNNVDFLENIERYLANWKFPATTEESGNSVREK